MSHPTVVIVHGPDAPTQVHVWPPKSAHTIEVDMRVPMDPDVDHERLKDWAVGVLVHVVDMDRSPTREFIESYVLGAFDAFYGSEVSANIAYAEARQEAEERKALSNALLGD